MVEPESSDLPNSGPTIDCLFFFFQRTHWKTSVLKEYPPPFCRTLSELFHQSQPTVGALPVPEWFSEYLVHLRGFFDEEAPMGPDFCVNGLGGLG